MSGKHVAKDQPTTFEFNEVNLKRIQEILKKYPPERKKSAVMPLLDLAQRQHDNWIPNAAIKKIRSCNFLHDVQFSAGWKILCASLHNISLYDQRIWKNC